MAKPTSKQQEALQLLDDLDNLSGDTAPQQTAQPTKEQPGQAADVLAFIDEVTQRSTEPARSTPSRLTISRPSSRASNPPSLKKKSFEASRSSASSPPPAAEGHPDKKSSPLVQPDHVTSTSTAASSSNPTPATRSGSGWGWGSVWSSTTAALQQARSVVDDQVKTLSSTDQARKLQEGVIGYVKTAQLEKIGKDLKDRSLSAFSEILNAVAPPISEHEVLRVSLSHDMHGYDGVESIVYQALAKVMEQVEGGDLVVNKGNMTTMKVDGTAKRDMNLVEGLETATKLARAAIDDLAGNMSTPSEDVDKPDKNPTTTTYLFMRIQPFISNLTLLETTPESVTSSVGYIQFYVLLFEPSHGLTHHTVAQAVPQVWVEGWDSNEWVEDLIVESLRLATQVVGQEYIMCRMGSSIKTTKHTSNSLALDQGPGASKA